LETEKLIETVKKAQLGDENAKHELYLDANKSIFYLALRMVKNHADAEDITQEVFITVHTKINTLREPAAFYGWVNQITANKCNRFLSKYPGIARLDDDTDILSIVDDNPMNLPDRAIDDEETRRIVLDVIDSLPESQRVCVMLYYYSQFSIAQIADSLELNENTVKSRLSLARAKIRAALEEKEKKEGIKLWGVPIALTPILRQAMEELALPEGAEVRIWENVQKAASDISNTTPGAGEDNISGDSGGISGQQLHIDPTPIAEGVSTAARGAADILSMFANLSAGVKSAIISALILAVAAAAAIPIYVNTRSRQEAEPLRAETANVQRAEPIGKQAAPPAGEQDEEPTTELENEPAEEPTTESTEDSEEEPSENSHLLQGEVIISAGAGSKVFLVDGVPQPLEVTYVALGWSPDVSPTGEVRNIYRMSSEPHTIMVYRRAHESTPDDHPNLRPGGWILSSHYWAAFRCTDCGEMDEPEVFNGQPAWFHYAWSHPFSGQWKHDTPVFTIDDIGESVWLTWEDFYDARPDLVYFSVPE